MSQRRTSGSVSVVSSKIAGPMHCIATWYAGGGGGTAFHQGVPHVFRLAIHKAMCVLWEPAGQPGPYKQFLAQCCLYKRVVSGWYRQLGPGVPRLGGLTGVGRFPEQKVPEHGFCVPTPQENR